MHLFFCLNFKAADYIALSSAATTIFTAIVAFLAYRKFLVRQAEQEQLKLVIDLIECIHKSQNHVELIYGNIVPEMYSIHRYNIFSLINNVQFDDQSQLFFYSYANGELEWDFFMKFYENPLLPSSIAKQLKRFDTKFGTAINFENHHNALIIGNPITRRREHRVLIQYLSANSCLGNSSDFKIAVLQLKAEILSWLKKHGITDLNLTEE